MQIMGNWKILKVKFLKEKKKYRLILENEKIKSFIMITK